MFSLGERSQSTPSYFAPQDVIKHSSLSNIHMHLVHDPSQPRFTQDEKVEGDSISQHFGLLFFTVGSARGRYPVTFLSAEELLLCLHMKESLLSRK